MSTARKSLVSVYFPKRELTLTYYNDQFGLEVGDIVYVDGKLEGMQGHVTEIKYSFSIKLSDYHKVIGVADRDIHGRYLSKKHYYLTFDREALPPEKIKTWFLPPAKPEGNEIVTSQDGSSFSLKDFTKAKIPAVILEKGFEYASELHVKYFAIYRDENSETIAPIMKVYAIVEGKETYEVEFILDGDNVIDITCSCYCFGVCKHEVAVLARVRELAEYIDKHYAEEFKDNGFAAAITKVDFHFYALQTKEQDILL